MIRNLRSAYLRFQFLAVCLVLSASLLATDTLKPPVAAKHPKDVTLHGDPRTDDYFWLREKSNPDVPAYLEAENAYAKAVLRPTEALQEKLYNEMLGRIKQTDLSVPYKDGEYFYYSRTEEGRQYPIHCRKKGSVDAPEQVTLDLNELAKGQKFTALGSYTVSDDAKLLAYSVDFTGFRQYKLQIKNLETGQVLPDTAEKVVSVAWAGDNKTLFYTVEDPAKRSYRLYRHGLAQTKDDLVYEEKDELFEIGVHRTRSKEFVILDIGSHTTSEVRYLKATTPDAEFRTILPRKHMIEYSIDHHGDSLYMLTNDRGRNFRLVSMPINDVSEGKWKELLAHDPAVMLENLDLFADYLVLYQRKNGLQEIKITNLQSGKNHYVSFPEPTYSVFPTQNREWKTSILRYNYQSLITPSSIFDYNMETRQAKLLKETEVLGGYNRKQYHSERIYATAKDGTKVPISLVYRKGLKKNGQAPMLLEGYGSYGYPNSVAFSSSDLSLLNRGFVLGTAHIRGGGEMGKNWHDLGRMKNKMNTFTDFIASAEQLVAKKYTSKDRLAIVGGSAGGLLMGAVTNLRPDLFKIVISHVPFVDVINTMSDASLPLTVGEFEEWGNPANNDEYDYLKKYCPYTNLAAKNYPTILVKTSFNDSQVMYWEPAKYVAKLRALKTDANPLLLVTNMAAGHGGSSGRYDRLRELALDYAFLLNQLGITQ
ncbi:MAG: S9 family peptidase [Acidobacteria bacterium]|nr:MAG: S9 family peptidase [Acidobacteriota bacterium]